MKPRLMSAVVLLAVIASCSLGCWSGGNTYGSTQTNTKPVQSDDSGPKKTWDPIHNTFKEDEK
jgi:hypothetical protein